MPSTPGSPSAHGLLLLGLAAMAAACSGSNEPEKNERRFAALGTIVTITAYHAPGDEFAAVVGEVERHLLRVGREWYPWADGELARLNAALRRGERARVSPRLRFLLQRAAELEILSSNRFNAGLGALTELWGFHEPDRPDWRPPDNDRIAALLQRAPGASHLRWFGDELHNEPLEMTLDLGGIAKGALLQDALGILRARGIVNAIVDIGGDLIVSGRAGDRDARIGIRRPGTSKALGWVAVAPDEAVATSGNYERFFEFDGRRYAHVLDPRTGYPADGIASVTVIDKDPLLADAAATALLVGGSEHFEELTADLGLRFALLVSTSGDLRLTRGMQGRVNWLPD